MEILNQPRVNSVVGACDNTPVCEPFHFCVIQPDFCVELHHIHCSSNTAALRKKLMDTVVESAGMNKILLLYTPMGHIDNAGDFLYHKYRGLPTSRAAMLYGVTPIMPP